MNIRFISPFLFALVLAACGPSAPERDSVSGNWQVMVTHPGKSDMLCYAGATPVRSSGTLTHRDGKPYLMVTRRASGKMEISASAGYPFMGGSKVELAVDDETHSLFYTGTTAWARSDAEDRDITRAIQTADDIELRGVSAGGLTSIDTYSSAGLPKAIARLRELCP